MKMLKSELLFFEYILDDTIFLTKTIHGYPLDFRQKKKTRDIVL